MKKNKTKIMLAATLVFVTSMVAFGAVPGRINFQGRLLDANRNPRSGVFSMTFSIWDAPTGGSQVWSETQNNVQVNNGMFAVQLGAVNPLTSGIFSADTRYLQIQVGEEILTPRERLVTSPYSFRTATAESVIPNAITDTEISPAANIAWTKISKAGSSLADLETRSAADLTSGILPSARLQGNYLNDVRVSSAVYADSAGTVGAHTHSAADITTGVLTPARGGTGISSAGGVANRVLLTTDGSTWSAGQVAPGTMISAGTLPDNVIASSIAVNAVHTDAIRDLAVTNAKLASGIDAGKITTGTLPDGRLSGTYSGAITMTNLAHTGGSVAPGIISAGSLPSNVIASSIAVNAVGSEQILDGTIVDADISPAAAIGWGKISKVGSSLADLAVKNLPQLDDVVDFTAAQGDILIRTATGWDRLAAGTARRVLMTMGPGANPIWGDGIILLDKAVGAVSVTNTTTETSIYSFTIPAGLLGTNRGLRITIYGTHLNNSGAAATLTVRARFGGTGGTIVARTGAINVATGATARAARIEIIIHNFNATNAQRSIMNVFLSAVADPPATTNTFNVTSRTAAAHDTTAAFDLVVTITHGTAHASISFTREVVTLELLQ